MTPAEEKLWEARRGKNLGGLKFRAQQPVGPFILAFYCPARKLVVELDGGVHEGNEQAEHDEARTNQLNAYGYRVIRFRNEEVLESVKFRPKWSTRFQPKWSKHRMSVDANSCSIVVNVPTIL